MRKFSMCLALTGVAGWLTGCGTQSAGPSTSRGGIAVVDLDKVASATGKSEEMKEALQLQGSALQQRWEQIRTEAQEILVAKAKELGEDAKSDEKLVLNQMQTNARNLLVKAKNEADAHLTQYQQSQVAKFRVELKPILQETAARRGLAVVIPKNDGLLLAVEPGVDITDDVIKAYLAKRPSAAPAAPASAPAPATAVPTQTAKKPAAASRPKDTDRAAARDFDSDSRN